MIWSVSHCTFCHHIKLLVSYLLCTFMLLTQWKQVDATYTHNIEKLVRKVCMLSHEHGETCKKRCLRASSLQCLSAMVISALFISFVLLMLYVSVHWGLIALHCLFSCKVPWLWWVFYCCCRLFYEQVHCLFDCLFSWQVWFMAEFSHIFVDFDEVSYWVAPHQNPSSLLMKLLLHLQL